MGGYRSALVMDEVSLSVGTDNVFGRISSLLASKACSTSEDHLKWVMIGEVENDGQMSFNARRTPHTLHDKWDVSKTASSQPIAYTYS